MNMLSGRGQGRPQLFDLPLLTQHLFFLDNIQRSLNLDLVTRPFRSDRRVVTDLLLDTQRFTELVGEGAHGPVGLDAERFEFLAYLFQFQAEELLARVDLVDLLTQEMAVQLLLQSRCVVAEDHGVYVELEGDARIAQLADTIERFEPARHADLEHLFAEGADVGNDVDVAGSRLLRHGEGALVLFLGRLELLL